MEVPHVRISPLYSHNPAIRQMLDEGMSKHNIADKLEVSVSTLKSHIRNGYHLVDMPGVEPVKPSGFTDQHVKAQVTFSGQWWEKGNRLLYDDGRKMELEHMPETVLAFGDMQAPLSHPDSIPFLAAVKATYEPTFVVCMGDEADLTFLKKHMLGADSFGPQQELEATQDYMREIFKMFPRAICLTSNHVQQRIGYAQAQGNIPSPFLRQWAEVIGAPDGWIWRDYLIMGKTLLEHGHLINKGSRASIQQQTVQRFGRALSVYRGHHHSELGDHIKPVWVEGGWQQRVVFTGCLMNPKAVTYSRSPLALGCVVIHKGIPHAVPMITNSAGRWVGKLVD